MNAAFRSKVCLTVPALVAGAVAAHAQTPTPLAQSCAALGDPPVLVLGTGAGARAGASLLLAVAAQSSAVSDISVEDPVASRYVGVGGAQASVNGPVLVLLRAPLQRPLPASDAIAIAFGNASSGTAVCAQLHAVDGLGFSGSVLDALGTGSGTAAPELASTMPTGAVPELGFAAFASDAALGTPVTPALQAGNVCSSGICLTSAWYASTAGGTAGIAFGAGSQTRWAGSLGSFYADDIFGNGFD